MYSKEHRTLAAVILYYRQQVSAEEIREEVFAEKVPRCRKSTCKGILKPGITFFGEKLSNKVNKCLAQDRNKVCVL